MAKYYWSTVDDFIQNGKLTRANTDDLVEFEGFNNSSDGYTIYFHKTGAMGVASQSPTERGDNSLTDALGYVWEPTRASTAYYDGVNLNFPAPFGSDGVGIYTFIGTGWQFVDQAIPVKRTTSDLISATGTFENDVENTTGFYTAGDSGGAQWKATSTTGLTPSQSPSDRGAAELVDGSGRLWVKVFENTKMSVDTILDPTNGDTISRRYERTLNGKAVDAAGTDSKLDSTTFIGDPSQDVNSFYLERTAQKLSVSFFGGIASTKGSRALDRYEFLNSGVWGSSIEVTAGDRMGYGGRIYTAASSGTTGSTPLTHTSGTASDGGVNWEFSEYSYGVAIADAAVSLQDVEDGTGAWARYTEAVRSDGAGTVFGEEIVTKNKGGNVTNDPYTHIRGGGTYGQWFAAGGDASLGAPANPSTAAIVIGGNASTWNKGIVFASNGITGTDGATGTGVAVSLAKGHKVSWFAPDGIESFSVYSNITDSANGLNVTAIDNNLRVNNSTGAVNVEVQNVDSSVNYLRLTPSQSGSALQVRAVGSDADVDIWLRAQGAGKLMFGSHSALGAEAITGYIEVKDSSGNIRKLAVVS